VWCRTHFRPLQFRPTSPPRLNCAAAGRVFAWGKNRDGCLGIAGADILWSPTPVVALRSPIRSIAAGWMHAFAVDDAATVFAWGRGEEGQLGTGHFCHAPTPVSVPPLQGVSKIAAGLNHTLVLQGSTSIPHALTRVGGVAFACGSNEDGQLGAEGPSRSATLVEVTLFSDRPVADIAAGASFSVAIDGGSPRFELMFAEGGDVFTWGKGCETGHGSHGSVPLPCAVKVLRGGGCKSVHAGMGHVVVFPKKFESDRLGLLGAVDKPGPDV
jgi:hypothetical protein